MVPSNLCGSFFAVAAARCAAFAFVSNAPRMMRASRLTKRGSLRASNISKSKLAPQLLWRAASLRAKSTSTQQSSTTAAEPLRPLVVCGPSGVGKGTIISRFMEGKNEEESKLPKFGFSISHTTREPRPGEIDGVHYHFVTREFMLEKIESGSFFIEHAEVHGNLYGTSFQSIYDVSNVKSSTCSEIQCLLDIDVEGVRSIKDFQSRKQHGMKDDLVAGKESSTKQYLQEEESALPEFRAKFIFIAPPSVNVLRERLVGRGTETPETLERRFQNAKRELEYGMEPGNFDAILVNDELDEACAKFEKIVEDIYHT